MMDDNPLNICARVAIQFIFFIFSLCFVSFHSLPTYRLG